LTRACEALRQRPLFETVESRVLFTTYAVDTLSDAIAVDGHVSLREAITAAGNRAGAHIIAAGRA